MFGLLWLFVGRLLQLKEKRWKERHATGDWDGKHRVLYSMASQMTRRLAGSTAHHSLPRTVGHRSVCAWQPCQSVSGEASLRTREKCEEGTP